jgi:nucleotidyltransferase/DNA polymerase involved in DNA repair
VGHLDADCFYVSAERARDPFLVDKPVGVLGNQGACVIARSYEMKDMGVPVAMAIWDAVRACPDGIYIKRDFRWYEMLSRRMLDVVRDLAQSRDRTRKVEYYSIDEFFFEVEPLRGKTLEETARIYRERVWEEVGVSVTVGIGRSRTLAKIIGKSVKPAGARAVVDEDDEAKLLADLPVDKITGIAGRRAARLHLHGIDTCLQFAQADRRLIRRILTASGELLWHELNGDPAAPINMTRPMHKSLARGGSLSEATDRPVLLFAWLVRNLERLVEELEFHAVLAGRLTVALNYKDGRTGVGQVDLTVPTDRFDLLLDAARACLRRAWFPRVRASHMHVVAEGLTYRRERPLSLFDSPAAARRAEEIARLKREVNLRHGRFTLRSGATLPLTEIYRDIVNDFDICDIRGKACF